MGDLLNSAEQAVELAKAAGAQHVGAHAYRSRSVEFSMRKAKLEKVKEATGRGISLRLYVDGRYSSSSTNDLRPEQLKTFVADAIALTRAMQPDVHQSLSDPARYAGASTADLQIHDDAVEGVTREDRLAWLEQMDAILWAEQGVANAECGVQDGNNQVALATSNGFSGQSTSTSLWMGSSLTLKQSDGKLNESWMWGGARNRSDIPAANDMARVAIERGRLRDGSVKGPTKKATMVVDPSAAGRLIGRLLGAASGRAIDRDKSFWKGRMGTKAVSEHLTIIDDPLVQRGLASRVFDGEGVAASAMPLIDKGVFKNIYLNTYYANKLGMAPTTGSGSNRVVGLGEHDLAALVSRAGTGIYVTSWLGGNADGTTGDYSFGLRGHLIENGQIGAPVGEMNITGNLLDLFAQLTAVGNDPWAYSSLKAPTLVFEGVDFSGA